LSLSRKNKGEIQGSFTPFRMTTSEHFVQDDASKHFVQDDASKHFVQDDDLEALRSG
jgi:hypothetical protein